MTTTRTKTGRPSRLAEIQIAEYNTLTSRITYYVTMQYAAWGIAAGLFGYLASLWWTVHSHQSLEWIGVLCLLAVSWAVLHINFEFLVIVLYLKEELLPHMGFLSVEELDKALGFERFLRKLGTIESLHRDHATSLPFIVGPCGAFDSPLGRCLPRALVIFRYLVGGLIWVAPTNHLCEGVAT